MPAPARRVPVTAALFALPAAAVFAAALVPPGEVPPAGDLDDDPPAAPGVAVVELFTSQGCSSCPPADALLTELEERAERDGVLLLPMSLHVDYWDRLGWADPYASPANTARQGAYAEALGDPQLYTPQAVVNGRAAAVGSRRADVEKLVAAALKTPAPADVRVSVLPRRNPGTPQRVVRVRYRVSGADHQEAAVRVVLLSKAAANGVSRGENAGRTLSHVMVVRSAAAATLPGDAERMEGGDLVGELAVPLPEGVPAGELLVAAVVHQVAREGGAAGGAVGPVLGAAGPVPAVPVEARPRVRPGTGVRL